MRKLFFLLLLILAGLESFSQQLYFVYIQSEDKQPFYVRLDEKIYSSTETGYLIIGNLNDGNYNMMIGFPKNVYPEQRFQISTGRKDKGFILKRNEKLWQLINLQNETVLNSSATVSINTEFTGEKKTDAFSVMLSNVVNDSAILYQQNKPQVVQSAAAQKTAAEEKTVAQNKEEKESKANSTSAADLESEALVKKEAERRSTTTPVDTKHDSSNAIVKIKEPASPTVYEKKQEPLTTKEEKKAPADKPFISKIREERNAGAYKATFLEQYNYTTDTIDIFIAAESNMPAKAQEIVKEPEAAAEKAVTAPTAKKNEIPNSDSSRSIVLEMGGITDTFKVKKKIVISNSDCKNFATENDVDKLRVRIIAEKALDDKLTAARKYYKSRCFNVQQIRALTELFPTEEAKYRFLDLSYAFTSDSGNFYLLEEVLTELYYRNRFKAMIRK